MLSSRVGLYFVLARALFPGQGVWARLAAGPRRTGPDPVGQGRCGSRAGGWVRLCCTRLIGVVAGRWAAHVPRGVMVRRYRTVAFDGCLSIKGAGMPAQLNGALECTRYPVVQVMALVETGPRVARRGLARPAQGEITWARRSRPG